MNTREVKEGIYQLSVNYEDGLFEGMWDIPNGVSLNSYIVKGEETALIDGVCGWDGAPETLFKLLEEIDVKVEDIKYVILNHMEPDHTGWLQNLIDIHSDFDIICTKKAEPILTAYFERVPSVITVSDGMEINIGKRNLKFLEVPNLHWPETMITYDVKTKTIFSCDAFGGYGSVDENACDDLMSEEKLEFYELESLRYYSNIVGSFSNFCLKAIKKLEAFEIEAVCPGHGIVYRKDPMRIINNYKKYAQFQKSPENLEVTMIWGSMYGMTEEVVNHIKEKITKCDNVKLNVYNAQEDSDSFILRDAWKSSGIILAMPTYEYKMFPAVAKIIDEFGRKKVHNRVLFRTGSYSWSGGAQKELDDLLVKNKLNWYIIPTHEFKGKARSADFEIIQERLCSFVKEVRQLAEKNKFENKE